MKCSECPYFWVSEEDSRFTYCLYYGPKGSAPCAQEEEYNEEEY